MGIQDAELINFLTVKGHSKSALKGNFVLTNQMQKEILSHYRKRTKKSKIQKGKNLVGLKNTKKEEDISQAFRLVASNKTIQLNIDKQLTPLRLMAAAKEFNIGMDT